MRIAVCQLLFQLHLEFTVERATGEGVPVHATKAYRGSRCIVPLIPNIRTGWRWLVSSTSLSLSATKITPSTHSGRGVMLNTLSSNAMVKNEWSHTSIPITVARDRDKFTLYLVFPRLNGNPTWATQAGGNKLLVNVPIDTESLPGEHKNIFRQGTLLCCISGKNNSE